VEQSQSAPGVVLLIGVR
jgi:hypothetical protein